MITVQDLQKEVIPEKRAHVAIYNNEVQVDDENGKTIFSLNTQTGVIELFPAVAEESDYLMKYYDENGYECMIRLLKAKSRKRRPDIDEDEED